MFTDFPAIPVLRACLLDATDAPAKQMRAIYYLRSYCLSEDKAESDVALSTLIAALGANKDGSALLRHEVAYVLGQIQDAAACGVLEATLQDGGDDLMVRHECAEALGAIGAERSLVALAACAADAAEPVEVRETSEIAVNYLRWKLDGERGVRPPVCACMLSPYSSVDPAPPSADGVERSTEEMHGILADPAEPLFRRYAMMFGLRNHFADAGVECVRALGEVLAADSSSAVLRHEVAYVLGQMQHPAAVDALVRALRRDGEHNMVRHEAAEALGAIEGDEAEMELCRAVLREFSEDRDVVVRESCAVALDAQDYWNAAGAGGGEGEESGGNGVDGGNESTRVGKEEGEREGKGAGGAGGGEGEQKVKAGFKHMKEATLPQNHFNVKVN